MSIDALRSAKKVQTALNDISSVLRAAALGAKRDEMLRLQAIGDTTLFEGAVVWNIILPTTNKRMRGDAQSLDDAFTDMIASLTFLSSTCGDDIEVICHIDTQ